MSSLIDSEAILSESEHWNKLEEAWGNPIDLEIDNDEDLYPKLRPVFSTLDLKSTTFDSSFLFKKVRRKVARQLSKKSTSSALDYLDFINDLKKDPSRDFSNQFYVINGQVVSARSVEKICDEIDSVFKSIEKLASATSTIRKKDSKMPDRVQCSISTSDLSFDDTTGRISEREESYDAEVERNIEEALQHFNTSVSYIEGVDQSTLDSVTTLVRKFSSVLSNSSVRCNCSEKRQMRQKQCCEKFKDLIDFWKNLEYDSK